MQELKFFVNKVFRNPNRKSYGDAIVIGCVRECGSTINLGAHKIHVSTESAGRCHHDISAALISRNISSIVGLKNKLQDFYHDQ